MQHRDLTRLAIICRHPVQYYAPVFKLMARTHTIKVFYHATSDEKSFDKGFNRHISWDLPLLDGYPYEFSHALSDIGAFRPTALLVYGWPYVTHLKIMIHFHDKMTIFFRGDSTLLDPTSMWRAFVKKLILRKIYKYVHFALFVGSNNRAYFEHCGLLTDQLIYAPHAIDNTRFADDRSSEVQALRLLLKVEPEETLILFAGKLIPKKNPSLLLSAFLGIKSLNAHLLFVGDGILKTQLQRDAAGHNRIHFLPFQNQTEMPVVYQACDLFCMPSFGPGESWGLAVNEAMAAGKAVIASNKVGAAADLVDEQNGRIFKSNDAEDLKAKLAEVIQDKKRLRPMGRVSSERIKQWTFQHQIDAIYGI